MSKNICILSISRHHTHSFVKKLKKSQFVNFADFFIVSSKMLKFKKSDSQNLKKWLSCIIKLEILDFQLKLMGKKGFQTILKFCKSGRKKSENKPLFLDQFWQQEESQLTSADVSYQMVGLQDYKNALLLYLQYI